MPIVLDGTTGITTPSYGGADTAEYLVPVTGFKNRIINGAMQIDQRNAGASVANANGYTLDRWILSDDSTGAVTVQQDSVAPTGFRNSLKVTVTTSDAVSATEYVMLRQKIEGFNTADLMWGTADAKTVTLSFWVRSSLTGTFGGVFINASQNRVYPYTYTISLANTWEYKTVTIAGDTSGTWLTTNGTGIEVIWGLGVGTDYSGTAGSWSGTFALSATGATSVVGTNGATFYITGVQLEVGTNATSFDYRPYGTELALCQRYFKRISSGNSGTGGIIGAGAQTGTTAGYIYVSVSPPMRATPTITFSSLTISDSATYDATASVGTITGTPDSIYLDVTFPSAGAQFRPMNLRAVSNSSGRLDMTSEL